MSDNKAEWDQTMEIFTGRLEGDDSGGEGETFSLQGDLGTLSINSGEPLTWKNKVDKGRTGLSPVSGSST